MGGLEKENYSLLTVCMILLDDNLSYVDELNLSLRPEDGIYRVCVSAMNVNKINLIEHDKIAIPYKEGGTQIFNFLRKHSNDGKIKLTVCGHGIYGDVDWINYHLISRGSWEKFTSYRKLDTQAVTQFFLSCGIFPTTVSGSLESIAKYFGIIKEDGTFTGLILPGEQLHNAKTDTLLTIEVFKKLKPHMMVRI